MEATRHTLPSLEIGRYRFTFQADEPIQMAHFPGSAWRGALGHALRRAACVTRQKDCPACLLYRSCAYAWIFETPPPPDSAKMRRYPHAPHPFILEAPYADGEHTYSLGLHLVGQANRHLGLLIHALTQAAEHGVARNSLSLVQVEQQTGQQVEGESWQTIFTAGGALTALPNRPIAFPPAPPAVQIELLTALRLKHHDKIVSPNTFTFYDLFANLLRRVSMLSYFHGDTPLETDFAGLTEAARAIPVEANLSRQTQHRYSSRQGQAMEFDGLIGSFTIRDVDLAPFWPYLWLGQWLHAGHNATMGLGQYRLTDHPLTSL